MNKQELVSALQTKLNCSKKEAVRSFDALIDVFTEGLSNGQEIKIYGFGSFNIRDYAARTARNPRTGAAVHVPPRKAVRFRASKTLLD